MEQKVRNEGEFLKYADELYKTGAYGDEAAVRYMTDKIDEARKEFPYIWEPLPSDKEFTDPFQAYASALSVWEWFKKWFGDCDGGSSSTH
jgi:hypothetical protein